jgi:Xaa-Pro aminopeptidase
LKQNPKIDAFAIIKPENVQYLTGFSASNTSVLITKKNNFLLTDSRYYIEAKKTVPKNFTVVQTTKELFKTFHEFLKKFNIKKIGFEADFMTVARLKRLKKYWKVKFVPTSGIIEHLREIKTEAEMKKLTKAENICDKILKEIKNKFKFGITEKEIAWEIEVLTHKFGADGLAFDTIVAFGKNSACPHHKTDNTKLKSGDVILIDMGVKYQNYCSDITRMFFTKPLSEKIKKVYNIVLKAQTEAIKMININSSPKKIITEVINKFKNAGLEKYFTHRLGHGVGLEIHENPSIGIENMGKFKNGWVFTIEPGIYLENEFGIRIEDMLLIYGNKVKVLSKTTKKITILNI